MADIDMADNGDMYSNVFSFMGVPLCTDISKSDADLAVLGHPYDLATSGRAGPWMRPTPGGKGVQGRLPHGW